MALDKLAGDYGSIRTFVNVDKVVSFVVPANRNPTVTFNAPVLYFPSNGFFVGFLLEYFVTENSLPQYYSKVICGNDIKLFVNRQSDFSYNVVYDELTAPYLKYKALLDSTSMVIDPTSNCPYDRFRNKIANLVIPDYIPVGTPLTISTIFRRYGSMLEGFTVDNPTFQNPNPIPYVHKLP